MSQSRSAGSRHDWGTRLTRRPPLGEYAHATSAILGPSAGRDGLPAAPRGVVSGGGAHPRRHGARGQQDRKSTRLNSSHLVISYAVFCLKKKKYQKKHHEVGVHYIILVSD